jgi:hypothetical protein
MAYGVKANGENGINDGVMAASGVMAARLSENGLERRQSAEAMKAQKS